MLKWFDKFDNLLTRGNEFSHFTSSAFVVNNDRTKVLMIYHNIYDSWGWIGGHADGESNLLEVALKETTEETGIKNFKPIITEAFMLDSLPVFGHFKRGKYISSHLHLNLTYLIEADEKEELRIKEDENSDVAWIPIDQIIEKSTEPHMKKVYEKAINKLKET